MLTNAFKKNLYISKKWVIIKPLATIQHFFLFLSPFVTKEVTFVKIELKALRNNLNKHS